MMMFRPSGIGFRSAICLARSSVRVTGSSRQMFGRNLSRVEKSYKSLIINGGEYRNRTGVHGFAIQDRPRLKSGERAASPLRSLRRFATARTGAVSR